MAPTKPRESKHTIQEDRIRRALEERRLEGTSFRNLAVKYGVSSSTLSDRERGGLTRQEAHAHRQKLTPAMEKALEDWCEKLDAWGFPPRMDLLLAMAAALAQIRAEEEEDPELAHLGQHWLANFLNRHPSLSARFSAQLDRQRANAGDIHTIKDYFAKLIRLIRTRKLQRKDIFNMDEKGFIIGMSSKAKVICRAGRRPPWVTQDGMREMLTVIECCCAALYMLPSFVIFKGAAQYMGWHTETSDPDAKFAYSPNGWTDDELALEWLRHFDKHTKDQEGGASRTRLLILDGHRSHITLEFCQYAIDNNIELLCFPSHTTHLLQPLDVGLFGPLQKYYGKAADDHMRDTRAAVVKGTFWKFYSAARRQAYTTANIKSAWRKTGIQPYNPNAVLTQLVVPRSASSSARKKVVLQTPKKSTDVRQLYLMVDAELDKAGVRQEVRNMAKKLAHTASTSLHVAEIRGIEMADIQREYRGKKAATTDRRVISKARVIDGATVMKVKAEKARQAEKEAHQAAVRAEAKKQRAAARVEAARIKVARAVATKVKRKGKAVTAADAPVASSKQPQRPRKILVSKSQSAVGDVELTASGVAASYPAYPTPGNINTSPH